MPTDTTRSDREIRERALRQERDRLMRRIREIDIYLQWSGCSYVYNEHTKKLEPIR